MNLPEALTEAARVAVAEALQYTMHIANDGSGRIGVAKNAMFQKDFATANEANEFIAARVNAVVFAWWSENIQNVPELCDSMRNADDLGVSGFHAAAHAIAAGVK